MAGVWSCSLRTTSGGNSVSLYQSCSWNFVCSSTQISQHFNRIGILCESTVFIHFTETHGDLSLGFVGVFDARSRSLLVWKMNHHPSPSALVDFSIFPAGTFCIHRLFIFMSFPVTLTDRISSKHDATPPKCIPVRSHFTGQISSIYQWICHGVLLQPVSHIRYFFWYDITTYNINITNSQ